MELFNSLKSRLETYDKPFTHWAVNKPLTDSAIKEICHAEIANPISEGINYDGTRAIDGGEGKFREGIKSGGKAKKYRCFVTKENSENFPQLTPLKRKGGRRLYSASDINLLRRIKKILLRPDKYF